jgi:competence protein ComGC
LPVQTDFGYGLTILGKKFDLYLYDRYGLLSLVILLAIVSVILLMIFRTIQETKNGRSHSDEGA